MISWSSEAVRHGWIWVLDYLGFANLPVLTIREVYGSRFDRLIVIDEIDGEGFLDEVSLSRLRKFSRMCAARSTMSSPKKLYVSRGLSTNRSPQYRVLTNEEDIESLVTRKGYHVVFPEAYGFLDQVAFLHRAENIVGPSGSGLLNTVFAAEGSRVTDFEVFHNTVRQHAKIYSSSGKRYGFVFGESLSFDRQHWMTAPWKLGLNLVEEAVDLMA